MVWGERCQAKTIPSVSLCVTPPLYHVVETAQGPNLSISICHRVAIQRRPVSSLIYLVSRVVGRYLGRKEYAYLIVIRSVQLVGSKRE